MNTNIKEIQLESMNVELTTACPLHCPQCYCSLLGGKHIDPETAIYWIREGHKYGVSEVMLSGGETLCYPYLYKVIEAASRLGCNVNISISGVGFTQEVYENLIAAGVTRIFVSLNGSTSKINNLTRDGYSLAIGALQLLQKNHYPNSVINWVMHSNNAEDFNGILNIAEEMGVSVVSIIGVKPDSKQQLCTIPDMRQMEYVKNAIKTHSGKVQISVERCFSPMLAMLCDTKLFGNLNVGPNRGCDAGRHTFTVNVDGTLSPCRHIHYKERFDSLEAYFAESIVMRSLSECKEEEAHEPCKKCKYLYNCKPCMAINTEIKNEIFWGNEYCPIGKI